MGDSRNPALRVRVLLVAIGALALPVGAAAAVTSSQITTPAGPTFDIYRASPETFAVSGDSDGTLGDTVDLACYYGAGPSVAMLAEGVAVEAGGSCDYPEAEVLRIQNHVCRLRAVPDGTTPSELAPFRGPLMATGEREDFTVGSGPNEGLPDDFFVVAQQLTAADDYTSVKTKLKRSKNGSARLSLVVPGPGTVVLTSKKIKRATVTATAAGQISIAIKPASELMKTLNAKGRASISARIAFTPTGGSASVKHKKVTLRKK